MAKTYLLRGSWNVICDRCGEKFKADELKREWTGLMVCEGCWEPRHPQDFLRSVPDKMSVPFVRPRPADIFVPITYTPTVNETVQVAETVLATSNFYRYIPSIINGQTLPPVKRPLNYAAVNAFVLGGADSYQPSKDETVEITDSLTISATTNIAETVQISETLLYFVGTLVTEGVDVSEEIAAYIVSRRVLNGSVLNSGVL